MKPFPIWHITFLVSIVLWTVGLLWAYSLIWGGL